ncbi:MAG: ribonuclease P protein component [Pedobacter sp.]
MEYLGKLFPRTNRIRCSADYRFIRNQGRRRHTQNFIVYTRFSGNGPARLGLTVSRKVGRAVTRNRIKRLLREFFRLHHSLMAPGRDISIVAKPGAAFLSYWQVCEELMFLTRHQTIEKPS